MYFAHRGDISGIDVKDPVKRGNAAMAMQSGLLAKEGQERHWGRWFREDLGLFLAQQQQATLENAHS